MAQPPFQADVFQVEPSSGQTLTIDRVPTSGAMRFKDALVTGGVTLSDMAGLSTIAGVLTVGRSGSGAKYTTLQSALNAIPASSSSTSPYLVLVFPGVYTENVIWERDGVSVVGLGRVVFQPTSPTLPVLTFQSSIASIPLRASVQNLVFLQPNDGQSCVSLVGGSGSTVASLGITFEGCYFLPSGVGCYTVYADTVNLVTLTQCSSLGASPSASFRATQCSGIRVYGGVLPSIQTDYSSSGSLPSEAIQGYLFQGCQAMGAYLATLTGGGSLSFTGCASVGNVTLSGNRSLGIKSSAIGTLTLNGSSSATLVSSTRSTVSGTGTLAESPQVGSVSLVAVDHYDVTFPVARPSSAYTIVLDTGIATAAYVTSKTATGFTIQFPSPVTTTVSWGLLA